MRPGLSPVFIYECLANSRRWQSYAIRSAGVAIFLVAIASIAMTRGSVDSTRQWQEYAALGEAYFYAIIGVELTLVMLAAPAATAGAICVDRARGTLTHMLVTDLTDPEIVLGKLAARFLPILGLVACTWPVLAICSLLGGIDPTALTLAFLIILAVASLGCAMALALSVWARKPHEVVLVTYTFWILLLMLWPIWFALSRGRWVSPPASWSLVADPYYLAFAPYSVPGKIGFWDYGGFFAIVLVASALLILLAVWQMRPVARRGNVDDRKEPVFGVLTRLTRLLPSPSLDRNPVLWREWHRSRPSRWLLALILLIGGATGIACVLGRREHLGERRGHDESPCGAGGRDCRKHFAVDFWALDVISYRAHVDVGRAPAGQPRSPGRDRAIDTSDRRRQVDGDASGRSINGARAGARGPRLGHRLSRPPERAGAGGNAA